MASDKSDTAADSYVSDNPRSGKGRVVIAGGSGFLGRSLADHLGSHGYQPVILARSAPQSSPGTQTSIHTTIAHETWDGRSAGHWHRAIDGCEAIVNLAGRTVDCTKTPDHCDQILRSRVESTRALGEAIAAAQTKPRVWVQMSTAHIYGDPPTAICTESSAFGYGLAPTVGQAWEAAFHEACPDAVRRVILRTSFVLGKNGGALTRLGGLARLGLGGRIGHGKQGMSWLHAEDMNRMFQRAIEHDSMTGAYIASAPKPVSNTEFMKTLRRVIGIPIGLPAAAWMVRIGAPLLLRTDPELAIYGRYVLPQRLLDEGFEFRFAELEPALRDLIKREK